MKKENYKETAVLFTRKLSDALYVTDEHYQIDAVPYGVLLIPHADPKKPIMVPWAHVAQLYLDKIEPAKKPVARRVAKPKKVREGLPKLTKKERESTE